MPHRLPSHSQLTQNQQAILQQQAQMGEVQGRPHNYKTIFCKFYAEGVYQSRQVSASWGTTAPTPTNAGNAARSATRKNGRSRNSRPRQLGTPTTPTTRSSTSTRPTSSTPPNPSRNRTPLRPTSLILRAPPLPRSQTRMQLLGPPGQKSGPPRTALRVRPNDPPLLVSKEAYQASRAKCPMTCGVIVAEDELSPSLWSILKK